jgi:hypothetical protein
MCQQLGRKIDLQLAKQEEQTITGQDDKNQSFAWQRVFRARAYSEIFSDEFHPIGFLRVQLGRISGEEIQDDIGGDFEFVAEGLQVCDVSLTNSRSNSPTD